VIQRQRRLQGVRFLAWMQWEVFRFSKSWLTGLHASKTPFARNMVIRSQFTPSGPHYGRNEPDVYMHSLSFFAEIRCSGLATVCLCIKDLPLRLPLFSFIISVWVWHSKNTREAEHVFCLLLLFQKNHDRVVCGILLLPLFLFSEKIEIHMAYGT